MTHPEPIKPDMPVAAPLEMRVQDLTSAPETPHQGKPEKHSLKLRLAVFGPALFGTALLVYGL